jgi:sugar phosphate isomerase/epimerase
MLHLSAFADEIAPDLETQIAVLLGEHIHHVEFRSAWGINVLDLSAEQLAIVRDTFDEHGISVSALGSPLGKSPVDAPLEEQVQRCEQAMAAARILRTSCIRVFSFYPPAAPVADPDSAAWRNLALERLRAFTRLADAAGITLLHENEKEIYGDTVARNVDVLQAVNDRHLRAVLDPANYLQCGQTPFPDAYEAVSPWLASVHVKDVNAEGTLVVAGAGEANWPMLLRRLRADGYAGVLALEPHLAAAGQSQGFSGPALFQQAARALKHLLDEMAWEYA